MTTPRIRMTATVLDVLSLLAEAPPGEPEWGLSICQKTGYGTGTIYPAVERLLKVGMITAIWEEPAPADRPRRRYFEISSDGRNALQRELDSRSERRIGWMKSRTGAV